MAITEQPPTQQLWDPNPGAAPGAPAPGGYYTDPAAAYAPTPPPNAPAPRRSSGRSGGLIALVLALMVIAGAAGALVRQPALNSTRDELATTESDLDAADSDLDAADTELADLEESLASVETERTELQDQVGVLEAQLGDTGERASACEAVADAGDRLSDLYQGWLVGILDATSPAELDAALAAIENGAGEEEQAVNDFNAAVDGCFGDSAST